MTWARIHIITLGSKSFTKTLVNFLKVLYLFSWLVMPLSRTFHTCLVWFSSVENSTGDVMIIDQYESEWYLTSLPTKHMSIIFPAWIYNMIQIHSGETSRPSKRQIIASRFACYHPLSPSSDQDQFSPNNIHTLSTDKLWELIKWSPK